MATVFSGVSSQMFFKRSLVITALLGCSSLGMPQLSYAADIAAKTSWAISRVTNDSQGAYCTMAQQYKDDTVLTLAKNTKGDFSLALDFKSPRFKAGEKQKVILHPQGFAAKTYTVTPQSNHAAVMNIGSDGAMVKQLAAADTLGVSVAGKPVTFILSQFKSGQKEWDDCNTALASTAPHGTNGGADGGLSVEGLLAAKPMPSSEIPVAVASVKPSLTKTSEVKTVEKDTSVKMASADVDMPIPVGNSALAPAPVPVPVVTKSPDMVSAPKALDPKVTGASTLNEITELREENARLSRAMTEQRKAFEEKQAASSGAMNDELQQKLKVALAENEALRQAKDIKTQESADTSQKTHDVVQLDKTVAALTTENETLKKQIQLFHQQADGQPDNAKRLADIQAENTALKAQIDSLKTSLKTAAVTAPKAQGASSEGDDKLRGEIRTLKAQIDAVTAEKQAAQDQTAKIQKDLEGKQLKMAGGNWDLEQATRRYQESQREIQRLGALLQTKDTQCTKEKKSIESMLFDPAIAKSAQISMLNSLEDQVKQKDESLKSVQAELAALKTTAKASSENDQKIVALQGELDKVKAEMAKKLQEAGAAQDSVIASLKDQLAKKDKVIEDSQAKYAELEKTTQVNTKLVEDTKSAAAAQDKNVTALKADLDQKSKQLTEAQAKLQTMTAAQTASSATQEATIAGLKAQLAQAQSELQMALAKSSQPSAEQSAALASLQAQVQQGNRKISELQGQIDGMKTASVRAASVAPAAASPASAPAPVPVVVVSDVNGATNDMANDMANGGKFKSIQEFSALLKDAGVPVKGTLSEIKGSDSSTYRAYSWKTDSLYGSVEMRQMASEKLFNASIDQYLARAKSRCAGDFAAVPSRTKTPSAVESKAYEIACVGAKESSSASVLFTYGNGIAMTVAHEGLAEAMDLAIDARDRVSSQIR